MGAIHDISFSSCPTTKWVNGRRIGVYSFNDSRGTAAATAEGSPGEGRRSPEVAAGPEEGHRTVAEVARHIVAEAVLHIAEVAADLGEVHRIAEEAADPGEVHHTAIAEGVLHKAAAEEGLRTIAEGVLRIIAAAWATASCLVAASCRAAASYRAVTSLAAASCQVAASWVAASYRAASSLATASCQAASS